MATTQTADRKPAGKTAPAQPAAARPRASGSMSSNKVSTLLPAKPVAPQVSGKVAADEVDLSSGKVTLAPAVVDTVKDGGDLDVKVRLPGLAEGDLKLRRRGEHFSTLRDQGILLAHPALGAFSAVTPTMLVLHVADDTVSGWVGVGAPGPVRGTSRSLFEAMTKAGDVLGWAGLSGITIPAFHNQFANGSLDVRAERLAFKVGGFLSGSGSAALDNKALSFDGSAKIEIPGGSGGELRIKKDPAGLLSGKLDMQVAIGKVGGTVTATLANGFVSVMGSVGYNGDRLSGKVTLVATDEATARDVTLKKPEGGEVPIELPGPDKPVKPGKRAYCGWGRLTFRVTDWLAGTATVIVNSKGQATIVGEIAPPREFILFEQKEWIKQIFKLEIRAGYGIPVVGQVAIFASIALDALAKIGPGKLYNIKLDRRLFDRSARAEAAQHRGHAQHLGLRRPARTRRGRSRRHHHRARHQGGRRARRHRGRARLCRGGAAHRHARAGAGPAAVLHPGAPGDRRAARSSASAASCSSRSKRRGGRRCPTSAGPGRCSASNTRCPASSASGPMSTMCWDRSSGRRSSSARSISTRPSSSPT